MQTYEEEPDPQMRYNMLLEFSSYLRQVCSLLHTSHPKSGSSPRSLLACARVCHSDRDAR